MREEVQGGRLGSTIYRFDANAKILAGNLAIFYKDIKITMVIEYAGVEKFVFEPSAGAFSVLIQQALVGVFRLRILVQILHVGVGRGAVKIEVILLHIFAMIALAGSQAKGPLFQNGIPTVPEGHAEHKKLIAVTDCSQAVLAPSIGLAPGHIVGKEIPGCSVRAVVLPNCPP